MSLNDAVKISYSRGYRILENGDIKSPTGKTRVPRNSGNHRKGYYLSFNIKNNDGRTLRVYVHKLAAYQKFGDSVFCDNIVVRHLNGNSLDNSKSNIGIGTALDNASDIPAEIRKRIASEISRKVRRVSDETAYSIREDRASGMKYGELCRKYRMPSSSISYVLNEAKY